MPVIRLTVPANAWSKEEKSEIASTLTSGLNGIAQSSGKGDISQFITVHILEASEGGYAMGGQVVG